MDTAYSVYREILIWDNKNRRAQIIKKQKHTLATALITLTVLTILTIAIVVVGTTITPQARSEAPRIKYYTTITVSSSDSLTDIAENFMTGEYTNIDEYINEICQINHIYDANSIRIGDQLIIPYYSSDFKQ